jgi:hypothetical protein
MPGRRGGAPRVQRQHLQVLGFVVVFIGHQDAVAYQLHEGLGVLVASYDADIGAGRVADAHDDANS